MACFLVSTATAVVTTVATRIIEKKENDEMTEAKTAFSHKLKWLNNMLWGGSALLAFEHIWHGEVTPWFPFLTNAIDHASRVQMLHEMATAGIGMTVLVAAVWVVMVAVSSYVEKRADKFNSVKQEGE